MTSYDVTVHALSTQAAAVKIELTTDIRYYISHSNSNVQEGWADLRQERGSRCRGGRLLYSIVYQSSEL